MKIRKIVMTLLLSSFVFRAAYSQVSADVNDSFYMKAQGWELRGLTGTLPQLRPYSLAVVERVLNDVIENGTEKDAEIAKAEYERIFNRNWSVYAKGGGNYKRSVTDSQETSSVKNAGGEIGVSGDIRFHRLVTLGYKIGVYGEKKPYGEYSPLYTNMEEDSIFDPAEVGPFDSYLNWNMNVAVGTDAVYGSAGLSRVGFGPFFGDGLALNDAGYHSANLMFNATTKNWSYASVYETIGATRNIPDSDTSWLDSGKYLAFHSFKWHQLNKLHVTYYENIVFGPRTNISYIFPAPYMAVQNIGGANDNLQMGVLVEVKPFPGFNWATDVFVDDIELNEVFKLNFDTKLRFGFQTGVIYMPSDSILSRVSFNYSAIMPYVYAHWQYENENSGFFNGKTWNYQNYTNSGVNIGSTLDPNSDKISLSARFEPAKKLTLDLTANLIRHSNSAEDFSEDEAAQYILASPGTYATDGTAFMSQMYSNASKSHGDHVDSAWEKLGFMTSDHKMYVCQAGLNAEYLLAKTKYGSLSVKAGYVFEYIKNAGVNTNVYNGIGYNKKTETETTYTTTGNEISGFVTTANTVTTTTYVFNGKSYDTYNDMYKDAKVVAKAAREQWVRNLYDVTNHYISLSVKYSY